VLGESRGIQQSPSSGSKISIPVPFDALQITKLEEHNGYISYRFTPDAQAGFVVTYQMGPEKQSKPDVNNAAHGFSIYKLGADNGPQGTVPETAKSFTRIGGEWQYGYTKRTEENFKVESGKDAFDKISKNKLPDNEVQVLLNEMAQILAIAVSSKVTSEKLYKQWLELSLSVAGYYTGSKDAPDRALLQQKMNQFITDLTTEVGSTGSEHYVGGGMHSSVNTRRNKYTGEEDTTISGEISASTVHHAAFEGPRSMVGQGNFSGALKDLRSAYWLFVSDKLINNTNGDKAKKEQLRSYGFRMEYNSNLREQLLREKGQLKKINAFYYPDQGNLTDEGGSVKFVGSSMVGIPLDLYYKQDGNEWVLYNYTTLAEPGKLNTFERRRTRAAGEVAPPQAIFDELSYDKGVGLGYIHYQTDAGTGGVVRVEHPWTVGEVLMTIGAIVGVLALALTGVGLLVEGVAATAVVAGDIAAVTIAAGTVVKLGESYAHGEPITGTTLTMAAFDIAIAILPAVRLARGLGSLAKAGEDLYIIKQLDAAMDSRLLKKLNIVANTGAIIVTSAAGAVELQKLSEALDKGLIDESTFYWAVAKYVGMGVLNVVMIHNDVKSLQAENKGKGKTGHEEENIKDPITIKQNNLGKIRSVVDMLDHPELAALKKQYEELDDVLKAEFRDDFAMTTHEHLVKMQSENLLDVWAKDLRSSNLDELANFKGKAGLRDEYIAAIGELKPKAEKLLADGVPKEEVARIVFEDRRRITIEFKHATPGDMLELILEFNTKRYKETGLGDEWGLSWEGVVSKATKEGVTNYDRIIQGAATPLGDKKVLGKNLFDVLGRKTLPVLTKYRMEPNI
jgi:hypothetical protein